MAGEQGAEGAFEALAARASYPLEPPRRSRVVELLLRVSERRTGLRYETPHSCGGGLAERVQYEYDEEAAESFWDIVEPFVSRRILTGADVVDIGCGWGGKAVYCAEHFGVRSITGFDLPGFDPDVPRRFAAERGISNCAFLNGRAEDVRLPGEQFDVAVMEDVLEHVTDPDAVLAETWRLLRPGGLLVTRFPSMRSLRAHHFDRALRLPGLHYVLPWRTWAAGLNHYLVHGRAGRRYDPFAVVQPTRFHPGITIDLNGMDLGDFREVAAGSRFHTQTLDLVPYPASKFRGSRSLHGLYRLLWAVPWFREPLSRSIIFVGQK